MTRLFPPDQRKQLLDRVMAAITDPRKLNTKRERSYPRVVKRARTTPTASRSPASTAPATIKLVSPVLTRENTLIAALSKTS